MSAAESAETTTPRLEAIVGGAALQQFVDTLTPLADEAKIRYDESGLSCKLVDPANVGMANAKLRAEAFESFQAESGVIGVDVSSLDEKISVANSGDLIQLGIDWETRVLEITINHIEQNLALIDPDTVRNEPDIPDLTDKMTTEVAIEGEDLQEAVKVCGLITDHMAFETDVDEDEVRIIGEGDVDDSTLKFDSEKRLSGTLHDDGRTLLSLNYVKSMTKPMPKDAAVRIRHGTEFPVFFDYSACEGLLEVQNMLAPRIQSR